MKATPSDIAGGGRWEEMSLKYEVNFPLSLNEILGRSKAASRMEVYLVIFSRSGVES